MQSVQTSDTSPLPPHQTHLLVFPTPLLPVRYQIFKSRPSAFFFPPGTRSRRKRHHLSKKSVPSPHDGAHNNYRDAHHLQPRLRTRCRPLSLLGGRDWGHSIGMRLLCTTALSVCSVPSL